MAVLNFPSNPNLNQVYQANESSWRWDGDRWKRLPDPGVQGVQGPMGVGGTWASSTAGIWTGRNVGIGSELPGTELDVAGVTSTRNLYVSLGSTFAGPLDVNSTSDFGGTVVVSSGDLKVGSGLTVYSTGLIVGEQGAEFQGFVTALAYYGDGSTLSGIAVTDYVHTNTLQVNGISTFSGSVIDIHGQVGAAKSVLTSTGAGVSWGSAAAKVTISPSQPATAEEGDLWWDSDDGDLGVYYNDGTSAQWVTVSEGPIGPQGYQGVEYKNLARLKEPIPPPAEEKVEVINPKDYPTYF